jgi:hypothetical protein
MTFGRQNDVVNIRFTVTTRRRHELNLFWTARFSRIIHHELALSFISATDAVYSDRMQDIRGVQASLHSYAFPQGY